MNDRTRRGRVGSQLFAINTVAVWIRLAVWLPIALVALSGVTTAVLAQTPTGRIVGVLKDESGGVVPGASIEIKDLDSGLTRFTVTDEQGLYGFETVRAGRYQVTAAASGFATSVRGDVTVAPHAETVVGFRLSIARTSTSVEVRASPATVDSEAIVSRRTRTSDTASLLRGVPGVALLESGGVSRLPVIHGLADDRVNVVLNGMSIAPACGNHMNPPLSYIDPSNVGAFRVMAGITPVSLGGDSIAGTITVEPPALEFARPGQGLGIHGGVSAFHRGNGSVDGGRVSVSAASENFRVGYAGSYVNANNYKSGAGAMVESTFYESRNHALQLAARRSGHLIRADLGYQHIPQQGFVNARMDMTGNESKFTILRYERGVAWGRLDARAYYENTRHGMNILRDKIPGMNMPMHTRGRNLGYSLQAERPLGGRDTLRIGHELRHFSLDDWWPPVTDRVGSMGPDTLWNVRGGRRARFGTYLEWETRRGRAWTALLGARSDVVRMNTDNVTGYNMSPTTTGSAAYYADAREFNARSHKRLDHNFDLTALARYEPRATAAWEFGYARKSRSPNLYERYLWVKRSAMSVNMNGWFGDGNGYTGNLDLRPEVAHTLSVTAARFTAARTWELRITPYYTRVRDFIDVDRCPVILDGSNGCTAARFAATSGFVTLQFANHPARLYGIDASGRVPLGASSKMGSLVLTGVFGYVRGRNLASGDHLYHLMPLHGQFALEHHRGRWSGALEFHAISAKTRVQRVRNELSAAGYALVNLRTGYQWPLVEGAGLRLDAGVENLGNRGCALPLGGRYWVGDKSGKSPVPGMGRSVYTGLAFEF